MLPISRFQALHRVRHLLPSIFVRHLRLNKEIPTLAFLLRPLLVYFLLPLPLDLHHLLLFLFLPLLRLDQGRQRAFPSRTKSGGEFNPLNQNINPVAHRLQMVSSLAMLYFVEKNDPNSSQFGGMRVVSIIPAFFFLS